MENRFDTFTLLINNISRNIYKIKDFEMGEIGLKSTHLSCMYYLYKFGPMTATGLSEICGENKAAISRSIEYLETNGYVKCEDKGSKRYRSNLTLTNLGNTLGKHIQDKVNSILEKASVGISESEREIMYSTLTIINDNLQKEIIDKEKNDEHKDSN